MIFIFTLINLSVLWMSIFLLFILFKTFSTGVRVSWFGLVVVSGFSIITTIFPHLTKYSVVVYVYSIIVIYCIVAFVFVGLIDKEALVKSLTIYSLVALLGILLQHFIYWVSDYYLDLHSLVTLNSYSSRYDGGVFRSFGLIRPTFVQIEPSNFASISIYLSSLAYLVGKRRLSLVLALSAVLTLSTAGMVLGLIAVLLIISERLQYSISGITKKLFIISILLLFGFVINSIYQVLLNLDYGYNALAYRLKFFELIDHLSLIEIIFGIGPLVIDQPTLIHGVELISSNIRDPGAIVSIGISYGLSGLILIVMLLQRTTVHKRSVVLSFLVALLPLFTKLDYMHPIFWFYLFAIYKFRNIHNAS